jgi:hypothetical protein
MIGTNVTFKSKPNLCLGHPGVSLGLEIPHSLVADDETAEAGRTHAEFMTQQCKNT